MSPGQCEVRRAHRTPSDIEHRGERMELDRTSTVYQRIIGVITTEQHEIGRPAINVHDNGYATHVNRFD